MIVCVCNRVSDKEILAAAAEGAVSVECLRDRLGVASCCGKCTDHADALLRGCSSSAAADAVLGDSFYSAA